MFPLNICKKQERFSSFLHIQFEKLPSNTKRFILVGYCLVSFSISAYLIIVSISGTHSIRSLFTTSIRIPKQIIAKEYTQINPSIGISKDEFEKIKKFRVYLDSLAQSDSGRKIYDGIIKNRHGLLDSLAFIENLVQSQSSKK
ncbi:hypothetical protein [Segetibacter koreensis]|uniref:hypothetical protein n=1 Tax=Segetibacter koreensis TaxID=398037 RepID=UPI00036214D2|nr:hypothetical protein [Segetibacter koreensis]